MQTLTVLDDSGKLRLEFEEEATGPTIRPVGVIDEDVNFAPLLEHLSSSRPPISRLLVDTSRVTRLNSCGIREWLLLMERMPSSIRLEFSCLGYLFVCQGAMTPGIFGKRVPKVHALEIPFRCAGCDSEFFAIIHRSSIKSSADRHILPETRCRSCSLPASGEPLEDEYVYVLSQFMLE